MERSLVRASRFLSLILRHDPARAGIQLDKEGWVDIDALLKALKREGKSITRGELTQIVAENDKQRFAISDDGRRIRANQGHSVPVDLRLEPREPPELLYHGTATKNLDRIFAEGLHPGSRQHVHLSADPETAFAVGKRHGRAIVLTVAAARMHQNGLPFYLSANGVWLTHTVPDAYLSIRSFGPLPNSEKPNHETGIVFDKDRES